MTKSELRKARKAAHAEGTPLIGELALPHQKKRYARDPGLERATRAHFRAYHASKAEQHARYLDSGPADWDA